MSKETFMAMVSSESIISFGNRKIKIGLRSVKEKYKNVYVTWVWLLYGVQTDTSVS